MKSYTDIGQSKKLAEILPLESADMWYQRKVYYTHGYYKIDCGREHVYAEKPDYEDASPITPCWSFAALLNVLPDGTDIIKDKSDTENEKYMCTVGIKDDIISTFANNPVDACVKMIIRLNELNLL